MTATTQLIMGEASRRRRSVWLDRFHTIHELLRDQHGVPSLGNYRDPVREILYIVLSAKTTESLYQRANEQLWERFPTAEAIANAPLDAVLECVENAGLGNKRALHVKAICSRLVADLGRAPTRQLRRMRVEACFEYLVSLPGVGPKSALCVMMYSLDHDVFPVDVNVHRIARRLGAIPSGLKHYQAQQLLPRMIPCGVAKELHIGMVVHGRKICKPQTPACDSCSISAFCRYFQRTARKSKAS